MESPSLLRWLSLGALVLLSMSAAAWSLRVYRASAEFLRGQRTPVDPQARPEGWEDVRFSTSDGIELRGWYGPSRNGAAVVLAHGWGQTRQDMMFEARALSEAGFGVLAYDARAHGESGGTLSTLGDLERRDLEAALGFVRRRPELDSSRIGALGFSMNATALADVAAKDRALAAVALLCPSSTLEEGIRSDFHGALREWMALWPWRRAGVDLKGVRPIDDLQKILPRPLWLVFGSRETDMPMMHRLMDAAGEDRSWMVEGAGHGEYAKVAPDEYRRRLLAFFSRALGSENGDRLLFLPEK